MTDCKSLYDSVHRVGGPRAPSEKRLLVDLAALRQVVQQEVTAWSPENRATFGRSLKWIPTDHQLADGLTKILNKGGWWSNFEIPEGSRVNSIGRECEYMLPVDPAVPTAI